MLAGLVIFIIYEVDMQREDEGDKAEALLIYFIMNIIILSLMLLTTLAGCVVYRLDHRERVSEKNPTHSLDVGLLVGASLGQFMVAEVATGARGYPNTLNLSRAVLTVLQLGLQNYFIIEGLHRGSLFTQCRKQLCTPTPKSRRSRERRARRPDTPWPPTPLSSTGSEGF